MCIHGKKIGTDAAPSGRAVVLCDYTFGYAAFPLCNCTASSGKCESKQKYNFAASLPNFFPSSLPLFTVDTGWVSRETIYPGCGHSMH